MAVNKKCIIGIDIGGSKINAVVFSGAKVLKSAKIEIYQKTRKFFLDNLEKLIKELIFGINGKIKILGIGCGVGGALDFEKGEILSWSNVKFLDGFNIRDWLKDKFKCEVRIDNDARCFTRGEYLFGAGRGYNNVVGITLGTGVGGGIVINSKIIYGANGSAGEIGHMIIDHNKDLEELTVKLVRKNKFSKKAIIQSRKNLEIGISNIINIFDPDAVIIGGGAAKAMKRFLVSPMAAKNVKIITGKLGKNAGAIGAAALFLKE